MENPAVNGEEPLRILVIDDDRANLTLIDKILTLNGFETVLVTSGEEGLLKIREEPSDVILLDIMMPGIDGYQICKRIKSDEATRLIPVIILTALNSREDKIKGIEAGCDDFISKPLDRVELVTRIRALGGVKRLNDELDRAESVVMSLARAIEAKDDNTGGHCDRLVNLGRRFGEYLGLGHAEIRTLERASVLHDVGKIGMPDSILLKPEPLTEDEWEIMRRHPVIGEEICHPLKTLKKVCPIIRSHHERWDGSGYPDHLKNGDIPYLTRVFQILDAYDALMTGRPYKKPFPKDMAADILRKEMEKGLWDPELMAKFLTLISSSQ